MKRVLDLELDWEINDEFLFDLSNFSVKSQEEDDEESYEGRIRDLQRGRKNSEVGEVDVSGIQDVIK